MTPTGPEPITTPFTKKHLTVYPKWQIEWTTPCVLICTVHLSACSYHLKNTFFSESTLYSCLNVNKHLRGKIRNIWRLSDWIWTQTHNLLVCKRTLKHLAKLANWLSSVVSTYLYGAFHCIFLSCDVHFSEWIHTIWLPESQGTPCSKHARNMKFKWLQLKRNP